MNGKGADQDEMVVAMDGGGTCCERRAGVGKQDCPVGWLCGELWLHLFDLELIAHGYCTAQARKGGDEEEALRSFAQQ